ncbi:hypothetical protein [Natrinema salifodinae]|uniref:Uncharacterized protein n=1 Tax=Natrinema salifodinae TaxID=1202768 RepID=A0A1I0MDQ8_9EURY|nr:hypothetical protein [Natrinema salifodinae]SEV86258.1 hypothetical protein SAMN05216285_0816 [Natrinema salifodinae]
MAPPEALVPAVVGGGLDVPVIVGWVIIAAMVGLVAFVVFLALGPGTQPYQAEQAEPTPTDDTAVRDAGTETDTEEGADSPRESRSG